MRAAYCQKLCDMYLVQRDRMLAILADAGFRCFKPAGAYYIMTDISGFNYPDDLSFSRFLVEKIGSAVVPGSSFYYNAAMGARQVRFTFCTKESTLAAFAEKLSKLHGGEPRFVFEGLQWQSVA